MTHPAGLKGYLRCCCRLLLPYQQAQLADYMFQWLLFKMLQVQLQLAGKHRLIAPVSHTGLSLGVLTRLSASQD